MLKTTAKIIYRAYHILFPSYVPVCRYTPTCSKYALEAIEKHGLFGVYLAAKRVLSCHPFSKRPPFDPVPTNINIRKFHLAPLVKFSPLREREY